MVISRVEISESFIGIPYDGSQNSVRQRLKSEEKKQKQDHQIMQFLVSKIKNNMLGQNHRLNVTNSVGPPKSWPMGLFNNCVYSKIQVLIISFPNNYNFLQVFHMSAETHIGQHSTSPANVAAAAHSAAAPLSRARGVHGAAPRSVPITAARCWVGPRVAWVESGVPMDLQGWSKFFGYLFLSHCQTGLSQWLWKFLVTGWTSVSQLFLW